MLGQRSGANHRESCHMPSLGAVWESPPPAEPKVRWTYCIGWNDPEAGELRFLALRSTARQPDR